MTKHVENIFDIEADDLLPGVTKMHVVSWQEREDLEVKSSASPDAFDEVFDCDLLIGHFIIGYDLPALEKLFGRKVGPNTLVVDTLVLSWYLDPERSSYGLESYGETFGIPKPKIADWKTLTYDQYKFRCERDVKINTRQWKRLRAKLGALYGFDKEGNLSADALKVIRYLGFKMKCAFNTEQHGIRLDYKAAVSLKEELTKLKDEKEVELAKAMPLHGLIKKVNKPKNIYKKDGTISEAGKRWFSNLEKAKLPKTTEGSFNLVYDYEQGNPGSHAQIKEWLFSLGWDPCTYKYERNPDGSEKKIPQVRKDGELTESVKILIEKDPAIEQLEGLTVLTHRLSVVQGFLDTVEKVGDEWIVRSKIDGLTNTFRFKHRKPLVNLPGVDKPYGKEIRSLLLAPDEDHLLIGSDMVSLEDTTKRHYMKPHDPDYVEEMSQEGFDPHLNLAMFAGACTQEEIDFYNAGDKTFVLKLKPIRKGFKAANYSAIYGVGKAKLARELGISQTEAAALLKAYWERNWAIKKVSTEQETKTLKDGSLWLKNPVSGFWMSLRNYKDAFSTLNQSTGVFVFDTWLAYVLEEGLPVIMQYHDEFLGYVHKDETEEASKKVDRATQKMNAALNLNVEVGSDTQFGNNYADVH